MERRSTNPNGFTHFQFDVTAHAGSSHGVRLSGGSTGGIVEAVGDDTNVSLTIRGQGTGAVSVGSSGQTVFLAGSTAPFAGMFRAVSTAIATPNFNTTNAMVVESSYALAGVNSSHFVFAQFRNNGIASTDMTICNVRPTSTNDEVVIGFEKHSTVTVAASTATVDFLIIRF